MTDRFKNYGEAAAAMQAGVSLKMELGNSLETQAKHLRVSSRSVSLSQHPCGRCCRTLRKSTGC